MLPCLIELFLWVPMMGAIIIGNLVGLVELRHVHVDIANHSSLPPPLIVLFHLHGNLHFGDGQMPYGKFPFRCLREIGILECIESFVPIAAFVIGVLEGRTALH